MIPGAAASAGRAILPALGRGGANVLKWLKGGGSAVAGGAGRAASALKTAEGWKEMGLFGGEALTGVRWTKEAIKTHPVQSGIFGLAGLQFGAHLTTDIRDEGADWIFARDEKDRHVMFNMHRRNRLHRQLQEIEAGRLQDSIMRNAARLAAANPHLYGEVMAGRRLPQGAVVFGGEPRVDLMQQLATEMAMGEYPREVPPDEQLSQFLGGQ